MRMNVRAYAYVYVSMYLCMYESNKCVCARGHVYTHVLCARTRAYACTYVCTTTTYWTLFSFFASQSQHFITENFKNKKSGEAKDSAFFPFFILLHKRAKPILTLTLRPPIRPPIHPKARGFIKPLVLTFKTCKDFSLYKVSDFKPP
jgi:hypothetical protein